MTLVAIKIITLNQCRAVWNGDYCNSSDAACGKKKSCRFIERAERELFQILGILCQCKQEEKNSRNWDFKATPSRTFLKIIT